MTFALPAPPTGLELVTLDDGLMWLMQPVLEGLVPFTALKDSRLRLTDFALMNDALAVKYANQSAVEKWKQAHSGSK